VRVTAPPGKGWVVAASHPPPTRLLLDRSHAALAGERMRERVVVVHHATVYRWVHHDAPDLGKRCLGHF